MPQNLSTGKKDEHVSTQDDDTHGNGKAISLNKETIFECCQKSLQEKGSEGADISLHGQEKYVGDNQTRYKAGCVSCSGRNYGDESSSVDHDVISRPVKKDSIIRNFFVPCKDNGFLSKYDSCDQDPEKLKSMPLYHEKSFITHHLLSYSYLPPMNISVQVYPLFNAKKRARLKQLLNHEHLRLCSFQTSRIPGHDSSWFTQIAAAGFYCSGVRGQVTCFSCGNQYNNFLAGIPLSNAHEPRCRWQELNLPIGQWAPDFRPEHLTEFYELFEEAGLVGDRADPQSAPSSATLCDTGSNTSSVPALTDSDRETHADNSVQSSREHEIMVQDSVEGGQMSDNQPTLRAGIAQEDASGSSRIVLTSAENAEPYELKTAVVSGLQGNVFGAVASDSESRSESEVKWDLSGASYPQFANREARQETFVHWPADHTQNSDELVNLGFFYSGYSDCARCFYCGLGLKYWRPNDNAAYQHARFRPFCLYSRMVKGQDFIDKVQQEISQPEASRTGAAATADRSKNSNNNNDNNNNKNDINNDNDLLESSSSSFSNENVLLLG